jgi:cysteinylglycine-S-conjugate dipeptidase
LPAAVSAEAARAAVAEQFSTTRQRLEELVQIPSVSADGAETGHVRRCAEQTMGWLEESGLQHTELLEIDGAHPAVFGRTPGPPGSPTVLLYAHHDVQPPGNEDLWASPPFEPTERGGRLFGRGTSDDKAGIAVHAAALRAWAAKPPVTVVAFIEGEEETGSAHLPAFLARYGDRLRADAMILADCSNWTIGQPALTTSLRGIIDCIIEVRTLDHSVHSGMYGGPVPDALTALCKMIATLHTRRGSVAVRGLRTSPKHRLAVAEADLRRIAGLRPAVRLLGRGPLTHRLWTQPAITVLGIDAPPATHQPHKLLPIARAKISIRIAPGDDTRRAFRAVRDHLRGHAPWGAEVSVELATAGEPHRINTSGYIYDAYRQACHATWGRQPVEPGTGGSLPLVAALAKAYPDTAMLLTGVEDPDSKAHGENESVHLEELSRCCVSEALFLGYLAGHA